jgi:hypothetical protein
MDTLIKLDFLVTYGLQVEPRSPPEERGWEGAPPNP